MRWPWSHQSSGEHMVLSWSDRTLTYALAGAHANGSCNVIKHGVERIGTASTDELFRRLNGLVPRGADVRVLLRPEQYQMVQVDAPAVAPEELRAAARYQVREMLHSPLEDVTLDVMRVGDGQQKGAGHLFVVAATNTVIRGILDLGKAMRWSISVIDIQETSQRNLQNAFALREGYVERASAALVLLDQQQAVLTISARGELFYTRRFNFSEGFLAYLWSQDTAALTPINDNVTGYSADVFGGDGEAVGGLLSPDFAHVVAADIEEDRAQRFLVEVQRSLDLWDRAWSSIPLHDIRVYAGERTETLSSWLSSQLGRTVISMDIDSLFPGFDGWGSADKAMCLPLLGLLLRNENRTL